MQLRIATVKGSGRNDKPDHDRRYIGWSPTLDTYRRYLTDDPTPERFATLQKSVDQGDLAAAVEICDEMEAKDAHLQGVASRRREALTALDWSIEPNTYTKNEKLAKAAAEYCEEELRKISTWPGTLEHLAGAIGPGIAVVELVWDRARLVKTVDVPGHRLQDDYTGQSPDIYIQTEHDSLPGVRAILPKFVVHMPQHRAGYRLRTTLGRATMKLWIIKHYALADWAAFSEKFGMPFPHVTWPEGTTPQERSEVGAALADRMADWYALTRDGFGFDIKQVSGEGAPYDKLVALCDDKMSILWLGQTLTTEQQSVGSLALGKVHENVRASIILADMQQEARTIEQGILRPMCRFRFPTKPDVPIPHWTRKIIEEKNLDADRLDLERLRYADERGMMIDEPDRYELVGVPQPTEEPSP